MDAVMKMMFCCSVCAGMEKRGSLSVSHSLLIHPMWGGVRNVYVDHVTTFSLSLSVLPSILSLLFPDYFYPAFNFY